MNIVHYYNLANGESIPFTSDNSDSYVNSDTDIEEIVQEINNNTISPLFRILVLYPDETINYVIPSEDIKRGGSYNENYQNGQRRSLSFTLYNEEGKYTPDINTLWTGTRLKLEMGVGLSTGNIVWFTKGVFVINKITPSYTTSGKEVQVSANDKFSVFEDATGRIDKTYEIPINSDIEGVIRDILSTDMGNGSVLDPQDFIFNSSFKGQKTQSVITKSAGDNLGSILIDLATQLSAEIFYDVSGHLVLVPYDEVSLDTDKPLLYDYQTNRGDISGLNFDFDLNAVVNKIVVIGNTSTGATFQSEAVNDDASSPLCYQRIGYRIGDVINDSNITSDVLASERASYELRKQLILKTSSTATISYNPLLGVNNLITISDDFFDLNHERFLIQSISTQLDYSGIMEITYSNLRNLPFIVS